MRQRHEHTDDPDLGHLVMHLAKQLRKQRTRALEPFGLSAHQARAFLAVGRAVDHGHELRLSDLAARLRIAPRSATEVVDALEEMHLVERRPSPTDRRATQVTLTDDGNELRRKLNTARADRGDDIFDMLDDDEAATLKILLSKALSAFDSEHDG